MYIIYLYRWGRTRYWTLRDPRVNLTPLTKRWVYIYLLFSSREAANFKDFISKRYASILAVSSLWSIQSKAFENSVIREPLKSPLFKNLQYFSVNAIKQCWALYPFWKPHWIFDNIVSKYAFIWSYINLLCTLETFGRILTSRYFPIRHFSSFS